MSLAFVLAVVLSNTPSLRHAIAAYDAGELAEAQTRLSALADDPKLDAGQRGVARLYLAATHFAKDDRVAAAAQLSVLAREHPEQRPDAMVFPPNFVQFFDEVRGSVAPATVTAATLTPATVAPRLRPWALGTGIGGVFLLAAGGAFDALAWQRYQTQLRAAEALDRTRFDQARGESKQFGAFANVCYAVGIAAAGTGLALYLFDGGAGSGLRLAASPAGSLTLSGTFQ